MVAIADTLMLEVVCIFCQKTVQMLVTADEFQKWEAGGMVQDCFKQLTIDEREALISKLCPECQKKVFGY
jgi:hypothetical protein